MNYMHLKNMNEASISRYAYINHCVKIKSGKVNIITEGQANIRITVILTVLAYEKS